MNRTVVTILVAFAMLLSGSGMARMAHVAVHHSGPPAVAQAVMPTCHSQCCGNRTAAIETAPAAVAKDERGEETDDPPFPASPCHPDDCQTCQMLATKSAIVPAWVAAVTRAGAVRYAPPSLVAVLVGCLRPAASVPRAPPH